MLARDEGCDLGIPGYEIYDRRDAYVHHMNPMIPHDLIEGNPAVLDPRFLITVTLRTHNAIHYGDERQIPRQLTVRTPGDTTPWRR